MISGRALMGPGYDNKRYPEVKAISTEDYMRRVPLDKLGAASISWESKYVPA